jgi:hypothetical protein
MGLSGNVAAEHGGGSEVGSMHEKACVIGSSGKFMFRPL